MTDERFTVTLTGPRVAWMPMCSQCDREVDGLLVADARGSKTYTANCHDEIATLVVTEADVAHVKQRDVELFLRAKVSAWRPFPLLS